MTNLTADEWAAHARMTRCVATRLARQGKAAAAMHHRLADTHDGIVARLRAEAAQAAATPAESAREAGADHAHTAALRRAA